MSTTIGEQLQETLVQDTKWLSNLSTIINLIGESGLYDAEASVAVQTYSFSETDLPYVKISPFSFSDLPSIAKRLLPFVGKFEKSFDEKENQVILTGTYQGIKVILWDYPPNTCTVERIEEDVLVPEQVVPEHTEKKVRYRLVGDCDPILEAARG